MDVPVNYWSVIAAAVALIVLGFVWYSPVLFGKKWAHLSGLSMESMKMKPMTMGLMVVSALVMAYMLNHVLVFASAYMQESGVNAGLMTGFWVWLGFVAPVALGVVLWEGKSWTLWAINAGYYLVGLAIMGVILAVWQ